MAMDSTNRIDLALSLFPCPTWIIGRPNMEFQIKVVFLLWCGGENSMLDAICDGPSIFSMILCATLSSASSSLILNRIRP
jgi:hypothetical protein